MLGKVGVIVACVALALSVSPNRAADAKNEQAGAAIEIFLTAEQLALFGAVVGGVTIYEVRDGRVVEFVTPHHSSGTVYRLLQPVSEGDFPTLVGGTSIRAAEIRY